MTNFADCVYPGRARAVARNWKERLAKFRLACVTANYERRMLKHTSDMSDPVVNYARGEMPVRSKKQRER